MVEVEYYDITPRVVMRVLAKITFPDDEIHDCWEWTGSCTNDGYGHVSVQGKLFLAHRVTFTVWKGSVPHDKVLLHSCDNRKCVNPHHLTLGTQAENLQDMHQKGRWARKRKGKGAHADHT